MLSFELSVIDIVLAIAVIMLLLLFLRVRKNQSTTRSGLPHSHQEKPLEKPKKPSKDVQTKASTAQSTMTFEKCVHHFGYLKNLPKNTSVPDECFGCPRLLRCMFPEE